VSVKLIRLGPVERCCHVSRGAKNSRDSLIIPVIGPQRGTFPAEPAPTGPNLRDWGISRDYNQSDIISGKRFRVQSGRTVGGLVDAAQQDLYTD